MNQRKTALFPRCLRHPINNGGRFCSEGGGEKAPQSQSPVVSKSLDSVLRFWAELDQTVWSSRFPDTSPDNHPVMGLTVL